MHVALLHAQAGESGSTSWQCTEFRLGAEIGQGSALLGGEAWDALVLLYGDRDGSALPGLLEAAAAWQEVGRPRRTVLAWVNPEFEGVGAATRCGVTDLVATRPLALGLVRLLAGLAPADERDAARRRLLGCWRQLAGRRRPARRLSQVAAGGVAAWPAAESVETTGASSGGVDVTDLDLRAAEIAGREAELKLWEQRVQEAADGFERELARAEEAREQLAQAQAQLDERERRLALREADCETRRLQLQEMERRAEAARQAAESWSRREADLREREARLREREGAWASGELKPAATAPTPSPKPTPEPEPENFLSRLSRLLEAERRGGS